MNSFQIIAALIALDVPEQQSPRTELGKRSKARAFKSRGMALPLYVKVSETDKPVGKQPLVMSTTIAAKNRKTLEETPGLRMSEAGSTVASSAYAEFKPETQGAGEPKGAP